MLFLFGGGKGDHGQGAGTLGRTGSECQGQHTAEVSRQCGVHDETSCEVQNQTDLVNSIFAI